MPRPKIIEDKDAINLIRTYYDTVCKGDIRKLKMSDIASYIQQNGYPSYTVETLRRSSVVRKYLDTIKSSAEEATIARVLVYKTLDVQSFIQSHPTRQAMIRGLTELDTYYKTIADSAAVLRDQNTKLKSQNQSLKSKDADTTKKIAELTEQVVMLKKAQSAQQKQLKAYSKLVNQYIYPEVATSLLKEFKIINTNDEITHINPLAVNSEMVTPDTSVKITNEPDPDDSLEGLMNMLKNTFDNYSGNEEGGE